MRSLAILPVLISGLFIAACGSGSGVPDASPPDSPYIDAALSDAALADAPSPDASPPDASPPDAALPDAALPDGGNGGNFVCDPDPLDYDAIEMADTTNDLFLAGGVPEALTGSLGNGVSYTIGGCMDLNGIAADYADADFWTVTSAISDVRVELTTALPNNVDSLLLLVYDAQGTFVSSAPYTDPVGLKYVTLPGPGSYLLAVMANSLPDVMSGGIQYSLHVREQLDTCASMGGGGNYTEADESAQNHRANDMVGVTFPFSAMLTNNANDVPEMLPGNLPVVTISPGGNYHLTGLTAQVGSDGAEYLDRDTFLVQTGPDTTELLLRLNWPDGDVDMDVFLFSAGDPSTVWATGTVIGTDDDEVLLFVLDPNTSYWLWAGTYADGPLNLPANYELSLCGATYTSPFPM